VNTTIDTTSVITCPRCGHAREETTPMNACIHFYECEHCGEPLKPRPGEGCVLGPEPIRCIDASRSDGSRVHELHESIEQPGLWRAQSGRLRAKASRPACSSQGRRSTSSSSWMPLQSPCSARSIACWAR
jgi:hypothetical protein